MFPVIHKVRFAWHAHAMVDIDFVTKYLNKTKAKFPTDQIKFNELVLKQGTPN